MLLVHRECVIAAPTGTESCTVACVLDTLRPARKGTKGPGMIHTRVSSLRRAIKCTYSMVVSNIKLVHVVVSAFCRVAGGEDGYLDAPYQS